MANKVRTSPSGTFVDLLASDIINDSDAPGESLADALDDIENTLFASEENGSPGYVSRFVWVHPNSDRIGTQFAGVEVTAAPVAWLTEADMPPGNDFWWIQYGAAGGSGSGCANRGATGEATLRGGGPSGGGYRHEWRRSRADLIASLPIFFEVPLGGSAGTPVIANGTTTIPGNPGIVGGTNVIAGIKLRETAYGGGPGDGGAEDMTGSAGAGGGLLSAGGSGTEGGIPNDASTLTSNTQYWLNGGCPANTRDSVGTSGTSNYGLNGGAGGGSNEDADTLVHGGRSKRGGCGGGHGGRYSLDTGLVAASASEGGNHEVEAIGNPNGGGGGEPGTSNGESGHAGADGSVTEGGEGGGGGFAGEGASSGTAVGGRGGAGGFPAGGSGGGGPGYSSGASGTATSGAGFKGGDGATILTILV